MKTVKRLALLLLIAAAGNSAKAQGVVKLTTGDPYTITSSAEADASLSYQWYRDGSVIPGATGTGYTVPTEEAYGSNVQFKRATYVAGCPERKFSNPVTVTWCNLKVDETCWADVHASTPGAFAPRPDMPTEFYQWSQPAVPWPATGGLPAGTTWNTTIRASAWTSAPCPEGWRLPTRAELTRLHEVSGGTGSNSASGTYVSAADATRNNAVAGRFKGPNHATCTLPSNMQGCVFIAGSGYRQFDTGAHNSELVGHIWSNSNNSNSTAYIMRLPSGSNTVQVQTKAYAFNIRCVQ